MKQNNDYSLNYRQILEKWREGKNFGYNLMLDYGGFFFPNLLVNKETSFALLKTLTGLIRKVSFENLGRLGLFRIPAPNGDEAEEFDEEGGKDADELAGERNKKFGYPFKPIPDVKHFEVELNAFDPIYAMFGIRKRFSPSIKMEKFKNEKYNRYMEHQLRRLHLCKFGKIVRECDYSSREEFLSNTYETIEDYSFAKQLVRKSLPNNKLYFQIVTGLLIRSKVFFVRQLMHTEPKGHREVPYSQVLKGGDAHKRIAKDAEWHYRENNKSREGLPDPSLFTENFYDEGGNPYPAFLKKNDIHKVELPKLKYRRVFIPKPNGKGRPLGVPTVVGRIYLGQGNKFLLKGLEGEMNQHQHAYQPKKSIITLGNDIMENIVNKRNIYSFDLTKYFDMVDLESATNSLYFNFKVPYRICEYFKDCHKSLPMNVNTGKYLLKDLKIKPSEQGLPEHNLMELTRQGRGIPQGGSLSPLLSIVLQESEYFPQLGEEGASYVKYADDGISASDDDSGIPKISVPSQGIYESKEKSFGVKKEGVGLKPLDFCGLRYDGDLDQIMANTRSGSRLKLKDVKDLVPLVAYRDIVPDLTNHPDEDPIKKSKPNTSMAKLCGRNGKTPKELLRHRAFGLILARLFSGSGEMENFEQDFRLTACKDSLVSMHYKHLRLAKVNVFTSTSGVTPVIINDLDKSSSERSRRGKYKDIILSGEECKPEKSVKHLHHEVTEEVSDIENNETIVESIEKQQKSGEGGRSLKEIDLYGEIQQTTLSEILGGFSKDTGISKSIDLKDQDPRNGKNITDTEDGEYEKDSSEWFKDYKCSYSTKLSSVSDSTEMSTRIEKSVNDVSIKSVTSEKEISTTDERSNKNSTIEGKSKEEKKKELDKFLSSKEGKERVGLGIATGYFSKKK